MKYQEAISHTMRAIYMKHGFIPFKMSRFEEYDLYAKNKDFLIGESVITFNDTDGRLLALKPDVTLSIIRNTSFEEGCKQRLCYNENVYRVSPSTHHYKEIMQSGVECIGDVDVIDVYEILTLAAESLSTVSDDFVIDISHMGLISALIDSTGVGEEFKSEFIRLLSEKNRHEAAALCKRYSLASSCTEVLLGLVDTYGSAKSVMDRLAPAFIAAGLSDISSELMRLTELLSETPFAERIRFDFSVANDMNYYNGIVFRGFINGICEAVLVGGEYGMLMRRMGKSSGGIGFAINLDLIEQLGNSSAKYDVDMIIVYSDKSDMRRVLAARERALLEGKSVSLQKGEPKNLRYGTALYIDEE